MKVFHPNKFAKNNAKVAAHLGLAAINAANFDKLALFVKANAIFAGPGNRPGMSQYFAKVGNSYMAVVMLDKVPANGFAGVSLFGLSDFNSGRKLDAAGVAKLAAHRGLKAV